MAAIPAIISEKSSSSAFTAVLCGVRSYELMEEFAELRESWLHKWLKLPNSIPCANTISRVFQAIEPTAFAECIAVHLARIGFVIGCWMRSTARTTTRRATATRRPTTPSFGAWNENERVFQRKP